jgi:hydroxyacylglutathione hydrolase
MLIRRLYDDALAQASYLVACQRTGEAVVVDPNRDTESYLDAARSEGVRVVAVTETHIHADFVSGARELARRAGARLHLSDCGPEPWKSRFAREDGAALLRDGDAIEVGNVRLDVLHTPGHTPEHIALLVTDTAAAREPMGLLSGDFLFVGDVGRPDLLERAAGETGTTAQMARALYRSLRRIRPLPEWLQIWPGHGAGSACGKSLGAVPSSTLGYELRYNWAFGIDEEERFIAAVLEGQVDPPPYFARMKRINRDGPPIVGAPKVAEIGSEDARHVFSQGASVIDVRPAPAFADGHAPSLALPLGRSFLTWAGWLVDGDDEHHLVADDEATAGRAARELALIGVDRIAGWMTAATARSAVGDDRWRRLERLSAEEFRTAMGGGRARAYDVRNPAEWTAGHVPGVPNVPLGSLGERADGLPRDATIALHCQGGTRSVIAASVLEARGFEHIVDLRGGFTEWSAAGLPVERG